MAGMFANNMLRGMQMKRYNDMPSDKYNALPWTDIDHARLSILRNFHDTNPIAMRCRNYVMQHLTSAPLEVEMDGKAVTFEPAFSDFFQDHYTRFLYDAYDAFMTLGFVPMTLVQQDNGHYVPRVLKYGTYWIQVAYATETEEMYYRIFRKPAHVITKRTCSSVGVKGLEELFSVFGNQASGWGTGRDRHPDGASSGIGRAYTNDGDEDPSSWIYDATVHYITGLGFDPHTDGTIRSPLSSIFGELVLTNTLTRRMVRAEKMMSEPPLTLQYHKDEKEEDLSAFKGAMNGTFYSKDGFKRQKQQEVEMDRQQLKMAAEFWSNVEDNVNETLYLQDESHKHRVLKDVVNTDRLVYIPKGLEHFKLDSNVTQAGKHAMPQRKMLDDHTAGLYGVPLNIFRNEGALRGNIQAQTALFHMMLRSHADMLGGMLTAAFGNIYNNLTLDERGRMFPRKGLIDDTEFLSYGMNKAAASGVQIIKDESGQLAPAPPLAEFIVNARDADTKDKKEQHTMTSDGSDEPDTVESEQQAVEAVIANNELAKAKLKAQQKKQASEKKKKKKKTTKYVPLSARKHSRYQYNVRIPVGHLLGNNDLNDLYSIGAITPQRFRELKLSRSGFKSTAPDDDLNEAERQIMEMMRDGNGSAVSMDPNGNVVSVGTGQPKEIIPVPVLLELARQGGNVEKAKKQRRADEAAARTAKQSRDGDSSASSSDSDDPATTRKNSAKKRKRDPESGTGDSKGKEKKKPKK